MRMLDVEKKSSVWNIQLYLTADEAQELYTELGKLIEQPESNNHIHIFSQESGRELSCSILTQKKMERTSSYSKLEQRILQEK